jgi:hypothetical protein
VADTLFGFVVPTAGVYPLRLVYQQGNGGAAVEWFSVSSDNLTVDGGTKTLVNDSNTAGSVHLYRAPRRSRCRRSASLRAARKSC